MMNERVYSVDTSLQQYIRKVFTTMGMGLLISAAVAIVCFFSLVSGGFMYKMIASGMYNVMFMISAVAQIVICISLGAKLGSMAPSKACMLFYIYSAITGFTFSVLPLQFGVASVFTAFLFAAVMFFSCAVIGHFTKVDLSRFSGILMGALIALLVVSLVGMFVPAIGNSLFIAYAGIGIFMLMTAWDMQRIKSFYYQSAGNDVLTSNLAVYGAFDLYLDFINIFLYVLRVLGANNSDN